MIRLSPRTRGLLDRYALTMFLCVLCGRVPAQRVDVFVVQAPPGSASAPGSPAPGFVLPDIHGKQVRLGDYRGQVVVLNFWAFWCDTWKAEMPHLQELISRQQELGFRLVAVTVDGTRLPEFRKRAGGGKTPFPILLDVDGQVSARYKVAHVPTVVIIDRAGRVRYTAAGYPGNHVVLRELRKLASIGTPKTETPLRLTPFQTARDPATVHASARRRLAPARRRADPGGGRFPADRPGWCAGGE